MDTDPYWIRIRIHINSLDPDTHKTYTDPTAGIHIPVPVGAYLAELGTSLFEIALSLFALERTLILRAMALLETKSEVL